MGRYRFLRRVPVTYQYVHVCLSLSISAIRDFTLTSGVNFTEPKENWVGRIRPGAVQNMLETKAQQVAFGRSVNDTSWEDLQQTN
jgi:hypothetical protein